jgi:hypothetical protein
MHFTDDILMYDVSGWNPITCERASVYIIPKPLGLGLSLDFTVYSVS